jgi:hypothetical protein
MTRELEDNITEVVNAVDNLAKKFELKNDFGQTIGDELHEMNWHLSRIADSLEKIAQK